MPLETIGGPTHKAPEGFPGQSSTWRRKTASSVDCAFDTVCSSAILERYGTLLQQSDQFALGTKTYHREFASQEARHMKKPVIGEHNHEELHCDMME